MPTPANIASPLAIALSDIYGSNAAINPFGNLSVSIDPSAALAEIFDGATIDTNQWVAAGTVPPTQSNAALINPGTAANASSSLVSVPSLTNSEYAYYFGSAVEVSPATGNHRFMGIGTQPGSWTAATPLQDAIGFEIDTTGALRASVYTAGTRTFSQVLPRPTDGLAHFYTMFCYPGFAAFAIDNQYQILASTFTATATQSLPVRMHSINAGATTVGTPTMSCTEADVLDYSRQAQSQCDGVYPWRKQTVIPSGSSFSSQVNTEGQRATYRYAVLGFTPVATPTAFAVIQGSATKVVRIKRIYISGVATASGNMPLIGTRRSSAGTLGSAVLTAITPGKHDTNDGAATAVVSTVGTANYTTLGTGNGQLLVDRIGLTAVGTGVADSPALYDFATHCDKPLILRGASDFLTLEGNGAAVPTGGALDIEIETEEDIF